jgi:DNA-binding winged helix-turn-helix (wHTH) protein/tetratricopeptide (TPR) repeat protein
MQFRIADVVLDPGRRELTRHGQSIELGRLTYSLLLELVRSAPNVVTHEELVQRLWRGRTTSPETVTQRVKLLRDALGDDADQPRYVGLVRGHGYRLMPPVETLGSPQADKPDPVIELSGSRRRRLPYLGFALLCVIVTATGLAFWHSYGTGDQPVAPMLAVPPGQQAGIAHAPTDSRDAYALYLGALSQDDAAAIGMLEEAIRRDEDFALAHGALALRYALSLINSTRGPAQTPVRRAEVEELVRAHARRAIDLNADAPDAYTALGVLDFVTWRWTDAEAALRLATELAPTTSVISWHYYGHLLSASGRHDEAIALAERARELDPADANALYAFELAYAGQHDAAAAEFEEVIDAAPSNYLYWHWLAFMEIGRGNASAAPRLTETAEQLAAGTRPIGLLGPWAYAYSRAGRHDDAARIFEEIRQAANAGTPPGAGGWTMAYLAIGDQTHALESLELAAQKAANHALDEGFIILLALKSNVTNDPVLKQPEFVSALARIRGN